MVLQPKLTKKGIRLSKKITDEKRLIKLRELLTVTPKVNLDYGVEAAPFPVYRENDIAFYFPRYFSKKEEYIIPSKMKGENVKIKFNGKLRKEQKKITTKCLKDIKKTGEELYLYRADMVKLLSVYI